MVQNCNRVYFFKFTGVFGHIGLNSPFQKEEKKPKKLEKLLGHLLGKEIEKNDIIY